MRIMARVRVEIGCIEAIEIDGPGASLVHPVRNHAHAADFGDVVEERVRGARTQDFVSDVGQQFEAVPVRNAGSRSQQDIFGRDRQSLASIVRGDGGARRTAALTNRDDNFGLASLPESDCASSNSWGKSMPCWLGFPETRSSICFAPGLDLGANSIEWIGLCAEPGSNA